MELMDTAQDRHLPTTVYYPASGSDPGATPACGTFPLVVAGHGSQGTGASAAASTHSSPRPDTCLRLRVRFVITKVLAESARRERRCKG